MTRTLYPLRLIAAIVGAIALACVGGCMTEVKSTSKIFTTSKVDITIHRPDKRQPRR